MERIKLNFSETIHKVMLGEQEIEIKPWIEADEALYIISDVLEKTRQNILNKSDDHIVLYWAIAQMNMLIAQFATNIDLEDVDIESLGKTGIFKLLEENVTNYNMIKDMVIVGLEMLFNGLILDKLSDVASLDDLENANDKIEKYMTSNENSDKVKSLIEVMLANNPRLASELDKMNTPGDGKDGGNEK